MLLLYTTRIIPILFFHIYLLFRFYEMERNENIYIEGRTDSQSIVLMDDSELFM